MANSTVLSYLLLRWLDGFANRREIRREVAFSQHSVACVECIEIQIIWTEVRVGQYTATVTCDGRLKLERTIPIRVPAIRQRMSSNRWSALCDFLCAYRSMQSCLRDPVNALASTFTAIITQWYKVTNAQTPLIINANLLIFSVLW